MAGLYRVTCEMDVEADSPTEAVVLAVSAWQKDRSLASWHTCRYLPDGGCEGAVEVDFPFTGPDEDGYPAPKAAFKP